MSRLHDELLNETSFVSLAHAREALADWKNDYNAARAAYCAMPGGVIAFTQRSARPRLLEVPPQSLARGPWLVATMLSRGRWELETGTWTGGVIRAQSAGGLPGRSLISSHSQLSEHPGWKPGISRTHQRTGAVCSRRGQEFLALR